MTTETSRSHLEVQWAGELVERPARCKKCGHEFESFSIQAVEAQQVLLDRERNVVYELVLVCQFCGTVFYWHSNHKDLQRHTEAFHRLEKSLRLMHTHQMELDKGAKR